MTPKSQLALVQSVVTDNPNQETYALRILRNQVKLTAQAEKLLRTRSENPLIREILANKKQCQALARDR